MSKKAVLGVFVALSVALPLASFAADNVVNKGPWERVSFQAGYFFAGMNDQVTVGTSSTGVQIDVEDLLGLKTQNNSFRIGGSYRFGNERRHRMDLEWFYFNRSASKTLTEGITVDNTVLAPGTQVKTTFNIQYIKGTYRYSFIQDDRMDLSAAIGLYVMPLKFEIDAPQLAGQSASLKFTAPLPTVGLHTDFAITPRWFLRYSSDFFYIKYQNFKGLLIDSIISLDYNPWKNFGLGIGWENFKMQVQAEGSDYPSVNFQGDVKSQFMGINLYARYFF